MVMRQMIIAFQQPGKNKVGIIAHTVLPGYIPNVSKIKL